MLELPNHRDVIRDLNFAPDGSLRLASASRDGTLRVWQLPLLINGPGIFSGQHTPVHLLDGGQSKWMYGCCWSPDANLLASVGDSRSVWLFVYLIVHLFHCNDVSRPFSINTRTLEEMWNAVNIVSL